MVVIPEINPRSFMISLSFLRACAPFVPAFGSCKRVWYFRCQGLDPRGLSEVSTSLLLNKQKKGTGAQGGDKGGGNMFLISVTVLGSAGPIRFIVKEEQLVAAVIETALKSYAREGRLPVLGSDQDQFLLYCSNHGSDALSPLEMIGANGARNFLLCKKSKIDTSVTATATDERSMERKGSWKAWLNKSFNSRISLHTLQKIDT